MSTINCNWPPPPDALSLAPGNVHLWSAPLDQPAAAVDQFHDTLSPDECDRADRFRAGQLRSRFVVGRGVLRAILGRYLAIHARQVSFQYSSLGKPSLAVPCSASGLRFNVSHSHGLALVAVAADRDVGVDVEWYRRVVHMAGMVDRYFSVEERRQWHALPAELQPAAFFRGWTCKEAWLKVTGSGLSVPLDHVSVSLDPHEPPRVLAIQDDCLAAEQWHLDCSEPAPGYVAALAVCGVRARINSWRWIAQI
jgi:4'-phosphopantetheinyl transferase